MEKAPAIRHPKKIDFGSRYKDEAIWRSVRAAA